MDLRFLIGKELLQTCFGVYQIILNFSEDTSISVERELTFSNKSGEYFTWHHGGRNNWPLQSILGYKIVDAVLTPDQSLILSFENKDDLTIKVHENKEFESYQINYGGKLFVI